MVRWSGPMVRSDGPMVPNVGVAITAAGSWFQNRRICDHWDCFPENLERLPVGV